MKKYPFQNIPGLNNGEVEGGETIQTLDGMLYTFKGNSHKRGGIPAMLSEGSRIFSDHVVIPADAVKEITGKNKKMTPAKLTKHFDPTPYISKLTDTSNRTDDIRKNTLQLMASKMSAGLDTVFAAQETHKGKRKITPKFQDGRVVLGLDVPVAQGFGYTPTNQPIPNADTVTGMSIPDYTTGRIYSLYNPTAGHRFHQIKGSNRGLQQGENLGITQDYQRLLSNPQELFPGNEEAQLQYQRSLAKYLRDVDKRDPDKFLTHEVVDPTTRQRIPVTQASDELIDSATEFVNYNRRTGNYDLVDGRIGNAGDRSHNHPTPIHMGVYRKDESIAPLAPRPFKPLTSMGSSEVKENPPVGEAPIDGQFDDKYYEGAKEVPVGINPEDLLYATQQGLDLASLALLRRSNPYYAYKPLEAVQSRFDPINQFQQDRAFNIAKEALENSNLPEQVKIAQLNQINAQNTQGRNQVDLTNYQGDLQNDNVNLQRVVDTINRNNQTQVGANAQYLQELQQARYIEQQQRQVFIDRLLENYRIRSQNKMNLGLLNQTSNNYAFNPRTGRIEYVPGQGNQVSYDNLDNLK